jgi:fructokinase
MTRGTSAEAMLVERMLTLPKDSGRQLVAIAGAPASGKSLLAGALTKAVALAGRSARTIPMDGFHLDNRLLDARGIRGRKGAPESFDAGGFIALMRRLKGGGEIVYPLFDRERDIAIAGAAVIEADCDLAIIEGNYLLLDEDPWRSLLPLWDLSVWLETPEAVLRERCIQRWLDHDHTPDAARARAEGNDLVNARRVINSRLTADVTLYDGWVPPSSAG